jgi:hypothetical protein
VGKFHRRLERACLGWMALFVVAQANNETAVVFHGVAVHKASKASTSPFRLYGGRREWHPREQRFYLVLGDDVTVLDLVWLTVMVVSLPGVVRCRFAVGLV